MKDNDSMAKDRTPHNIPLHTPEDFEGMRKAGRLAAECLDFITPHVDVNVSTETLNTLCHDFIIAHGALPAPLNYKGFPKSICTSVNHVICHGIPTDKKKLQKGDILNIDVTVILDGWYGDSSRMFPIGKVGVQGRKLIDVTYDCMMLGIDAVRPGAKLSDIGKAIQPYAESHRFSVVRDFCGHGLGRVFHTEPKVMHYNELEDERPKKRQEDITLEEGMFFTIEPMINVGTWEMKILEDGWTAVTRDKKLSAQFEHSLAVTADGFEIFTESPKGWHKPPYK